MTTLFDQDQTTQLDLSEQLHTELAQNEFLAERLAELELAIEDQGWSRLSLDTDWEFSRDGLDRIIALSRLNALKNPLIKRAVDIRSMYVHGQGVDIEARDTEIQELVIKPMLSDRGNRQELFDGPARSAKDRTLTVDGQVVLVLHPHRITGAVNIRSIDVEEIRDKIVNPDDRQDTWFYLRRWTERRIIDNGQRSTATVSREAWYPDWRHRPAKLARPESIDAVQIRWNSPIMHVMGQSGLEAMRFSVPDTYAALDWARSYKLFLEDWATIVRSLSRFAWEMTVKKNPGAAAAKMGSTAGAGRSETNPSPAAGSVFTASADTKLTAINKSGATVEAESGVPLAKMVGAAMHIPYTILMGDADVGNLATAKTLDRPTELAMESRRDVWADVYRDLAEYAVWEAVLAPGGPLTGAVRVDADHQTVIELGDGVTSDGDPLTPLARLGIDVDFPPILNVNIKEMMEALVLANSTELPAPSVILRSILVTLGVDNVDEHMADFDEDEWRAERQNLAQGLIDRFNRGEDPVDVMRKDPA